MWKCLGWQFAPKLRLEFNCFAKSLNEMWFYLVVSDLFIYLFIQKFMLCTFRLDSDYQHAYQTRASCWGGRAGANAVTEFFREESFLYLDGQNLYHHLVRSCSMDDCLIMIIGMKIFLLQSHDRDASCFYRIVGCMPLYVDLFTEGLWPIRAVFQFKFTPYSRTLDQHIRC